MMIGLKELFKFLRLALIGTLLTPSQMFLLKGDYYISKKLGLAFKKPKEWEFEALTGFPDLDRGQILSDLERDTQEEILEDHIETLVAVITKYSSSDLRFGPGITIHRNIEDYQSLSGGIVEMIHNYISDLKTLLKDYNCYETPEEIRLSNCNAIRFKSRYVFEHEKIKPILIDDEFIGLEHRESFYSIHLYDSPYEGEVAPEEFKVFLSSMYLI